MANDLNCLIFCNLAESRNFLQLDKFKRKVKTRDNLSTQSSSQHCYQAIQH